VTLATAFAVNFGLQVMVARFMQQPPFLGERAGWAICAGNRNIALFLAALPPAVSDPILLFIGCYQIPMYLTPILLARMYRLSWAG
jgi:arsenite transporter